MYWVNKSICWSLIQLFYDLELRHWNFFHNKQIKELLLQNRSSLMGKHWHPAEQMEGPHISSVWRLIHVFDACECVGGELFFPVVFLFFWCNDWKFLLLLVVLGRTGRHLRIFGLKETKFVDVAVLSPAYAQCMEFLKDLKIRLKQFKLLEEIRN